MLCRLSGPASPKGPQAKPVSPPAKPAPDAQGERFRLLTLFTLTHLALQCSVCASASCTGTSSMSKYEWQCTAALLAAIVGVLDLAPDQCQA